MPDNAGGCGRPASNGAYPTLAAVHAFLTDSSADGSMAPPPGSFRRQIPAGESRPSPDEPIQPDASLEVRYAPGSNIEMVVTDSALEKLLEGATESLARFTQEGALTHVVHPSSTESTARRRWSPSRIGPSRYCSMVRIDSAPRSSGDFDSTRTTPTR